MTFCGYDVMTFGIETWTDAHTISEGAASPYPHQLRGQGSAVSSLTGAPTKNVFSIAI